MKLCSLPGVADMGQQGQKQWCSPSVIAICWELDVYKRGTVLDILLLVRVQEFLLQNNW